TVILCFPVPRSPQRTSISPAGNLELRRVHRVLSLLWTRLVEDHHPLGAEAVGELAEAMREERLAHLHINLAALRQGVVDPLRLLDRIHAQRQIRAAHRLIVGHVRGQQNCAANLHGAVQHLVAIPRRRVFVRLGHVAPFHGELDLRAQVLLIKAKGLGAVAAEVDIRVHLHCGVFLQLSESGSQDSCRSCFDALREICKILLTPYRLVGSIPISWYGDKRKMSAQQVKLDSTANTPVLHSRGGGVGGEAPSSRQKLLDAALHVIRSKGYAATTVDDICAAAGVTKGSFFHHFKSKDDLALAAVAHWRAMTEGFFATAPYHQHADPLDRLLGYVDFRAAILTGEIPDYTCLLGTLVQETYGTHPHIRQACEV